MTMRRRTTRGFTIIELMVVLACIGLLLSIAAPRFLQHIDHAREVTLRQDLQQVRVAIDQEFEADRIALSRHARRAGARATTCAAFLSIRSPFARILWKLQSRHWARLRRGVTDPHSGARRVSPRMEVPYASW